MKPLLATDNPYDKWVRAESEAWHAKHENQLRCGYPESAAPVAQPALFDFAQSNFPERCNAWLKLNRTPSEVYEDAECTRIAQETGWNFLSP